MDEEASVLQAEEAPAPAAPRPPAWSPWSDLPPPSRPRAQGALLAWVRDTLLVGWPEPASALAGCYPAHADAVADCRALKAKLDAAFAPPVADGQIDAAPVQRVLDWAVDLERARERWTVSFKCCTSETCYRSTPPDHIGTAAAHAVVVTAAAAQVAWGAVPPDLPAPVEPWEVAAQSAAAQATAPEEEDGEPTATLDIISPAETW